MLWSEGRSATQSLADVQVSHNEHADAYVLAWGDDGRGQCLGGARSSLAAVVSTPSFVRLPEGRRDFSQLCAGWEQSFLISGRGRLWGGGSNRGACLSEEGDLERILGVQPVDLAEAENFEAGSISAGQDHFVAVQRGGGTLMTWSSSNEFGQTGHGPERVGLGHCQPRIFPLQVGVRVCAVACGKDHTLALTERGEVYAWGDGSLGQLGVRPARRGPGGPAPGTEGGPLDYESAPRRVEAGALRGLPVRQVAAGMQHSMALGLSGQVMTWGCNRRGRLGLGLDDETVPLPTVAELPGAARSLAAGGRHSGVVLRKGRAMLAGDNRSGQLGHPPADVESVGIFLELPFEDYSLRVRAMALGEAHTLLLSSTGELFGIGANDRGQLGDSTAGSEFHDVPLRIPMPDSDLIIWAVAAGVGHTLVLSSQPPATHSRCQTPDPRPTSSASDRSLRRAGSMPASGNAAKLAASAAARVAQEHAQRALAGPTMSAAMEEEEEEDDLAPLMRTVAHFGGSIPPESPVDMMDTDMEPLPRLPSRCGSKLSHSGKVVVPLKEPNGITDTLFLSRPVVRPGAAPGVDFSCITVEELRVMVQALPQAPSTGGAANSVANAAPFAGSSSETARAGVAAASGAIASVSGDETNEARDHLRTTVAAALKYPTVLGASFLFPAMYEARLNAGALCEQIVEARKRLGNSREQERTWVASVIMGLRALAPAGGVLRNMRTRDQVRALVVYLLLPNWPVLLTAERGSDWESTGAPQAYEAATELLRTVARLPASGRNSFVDVVADECGDIRVLYGVLLPTARALASAALRHCQRQSRLETPVWESVLLLQFLWAADQRRMDTAAAATRAARLAAPGTVQAAESSSNSGTARNSKVFARSLSGTDRSMSGNMWTASSGVQGATGPAGDVHKTGAAVGVALPRTEFQIQSLIEIGLPADLELRLFSQHARMQVIDPAQLCTDPRWEIDARGALPLAFMSFMANGNLVPTSFKQQVLQAENVSRQQQEQHRQVMSQAGGLLQILPTGGIQVPAAAVFFVLQVQRSRLLHETMVALQNAAPQELRKPIKIKFTDEDGVDEGGVAKEYFRLLSVQLFHPDYNMFKCDPDSRYLWFDPGSFNEAEDFWTVGAVVGLAVYNNLPGLDVSFPPALFKKLKDLPVTLEDLSLAFPSRGTSLQALIDWVPPEGMSPEEADQLFQDTFCIDFSVSYEVCGESVTVSLVGGDEGNPPPVTFQEREKFVKLFTEWHLTEGVKKQFDAFKRGFSRVCGSPVFNCLSATELEAIVCGEKDLNVAHLRKGSHIVDSEVSFKEGYIDAFWQILESFTATQKRQFLKFVTGSDLAPVGGLERLGLKLQRNGGEPTCRLPTAHTCFNLLMLPEYEDHEKLQRLLVSAIENAEGFGLE
eukprot:TRINITY_DN54492_c0_g1_i1.p1 TRINITY_DN54492_c0_g1~~TRINITY_DN54492_c0_g1_i1.p1  ORF type:complete len:1400 (-),score=242.58 TRINITY_DN54492_c0_g1_i1:173-4372(-)